MFTPQNIKKLTNVSIIVYKTGSKKFELALYPNKLYDYKNKLTNNLSEILHTYQIFKDVSKGQIANKKEIETVFGKKKEDEIIKFILENGVEKKSEKTRNYELEKKENEIVNIISKKLIYENKLMNIDVIKTLLRKFNCKIDMKKESKVLANEFIKAILNDDAYDVLPMKIAVDNKIVYIKSKEFNTFKEDCEKRGVSYFIKQDDEIEEEEIC